MKHRLIEYLRQDMPQTEINGRWVPARPVSAPFLSRLQDAWAVLRGRADAFVWPEDDAALLREWRERRPNRRDVNPNDDEEVPSG